MVNYKTLVLGASTDPERYSYQAVQRLVAAKIPVVPMGIKKGHIEGILMVPPLDPQKDIHTVSLYLSPSRQEEYFDFIIELQPKRVLFNPGTENPDFYLQLKNKFIDIEALNQFDDPEIISLKNHPFFISCAFCPQISSTRDIPHPIIYTFLKMAVSKKIKPE